MKVYVNFGEWAVAQAANEGFDGIRCDVPNDTFDVPHLVEQFVGSVVRPLFLVHDVAQAQPLMDAALPQLGVNGFDMEIFNEPPGLDHVTDDQYVDGINAVHRDARARQFEGRVFAGGLANLGRENIARMRAYVPKLDADVDVAFHRYSYKTQTDWQRPWPPFRDRDDEMTTLLAIAGDRALACTEFGYHTAEEEEGFWIWTTKVRLTDAQAADRLRWDLNHYADHGIVLAAIYQWRDGNTDNYLGRYGLHDQDGHPKPQLAAVQDWA